MKQPISDSCALEIINADGNGWLGKLPTPDEQEILAYLQKRRFPPSRILHVGLGNSLFFQALGSRVKQGITLDGKEAEFASGLGLATILANKYSVASYMSNILGAFDCVIDVNIYSYSCCDTHFRDYLDLLHANLLPHGVLLTSCRGLAYRKPITINDLRVLCPKWTIGVRGNIVALLPGRGIMKSLELSFRW